MSYVIIGMSLLFVAIGFIVTEDNAKYLLSGYNTMNEEDKKKVDIKSYIPYFRKFHVYFGISFLIFGLTLTYLICENVGGIFLGVYPILAYLYLIWSSSKYSKGLSTKSNKIGIFVLLGVLMLVLGLFVMGFKEDKLIFNGEKIEFQGSYGEELAQSKVRTIELVNELPNIILKTDGFAVGSIKKGYFKTNEGEIIKLILNTDAKPYILLTMENGKKIYFSSKEKSNKQIYNELKKTLPNIVYKQ
jgi:hypothetical protein